MKKVTTVETEVGNLMGYDWLFYTPEGKEEATEVNDENCEEAAKVLKISPEALQAIRDALTFMSDSIIEALVNDLIDLYNK